MVFENTYDISTLWMKQTYFKRFITVKNFIRIRIYNDIRSPAQQVYIIIIALDIMSECVILGIGIIVLSLYHLWSPDKSVKRTWRIQIENNVCKVL